MGVRVGETMGEYRLRQIETLKHSLEHMNYGPTALRARQIIELQLWEHTLQRDVQENEERDET